MEPNDFDEHFIEPELAQDFKELLKLFNENKLRYFKICTQIILLLDVHNI
jgi:hypothetical protein